MQLLMLPAILTLDVRAINRPECECSVRPSFGSLRVPVASDHAERTLQVARNAESSSLPTFRCLTLFEDLMAPSLQIGHLLLVLYDFTRAVSTFVALRSSSEQSLGVLHSFTRLAPNLRSQMRITNQALRRL